MPSFFVVSGLGVQHLLSCCYGLCLAREEGPAPSPFSLLTISTRASCDIPQGIRFWRLEGAMGVSLWHLPANPELIASFGLLFPFAILPQALARPASLTAPVRAPPASRAPPTPRSLLFSPGTTLCNKAPRCSAPVGGCHRNTAQQAALGLGLLYS